MDIAPGEVLFECDRQDTLGGYIVAQGSGEVTLQLAPSASFEEVARRGVRALEALPSPPRVLRASNPCTRRYLLEHPRLGAPLAPAEERSPAIPQVSSLLRSTLLEALREEPLPGPGWEVYATDASSSLQEGVQGAWAYLSLGGVQAWGRGFGKNADLELLGLLECVRALPRDRPAVVFTDNLNAVNYLQGNCVPQGALQCHLLALLREALGEHPQEVRVRWVRGHVLHPTTPQEVLNKAADRLARLAKAGGAWEKEEHLRLWLGRALGRLGNENLLRGC